jgi:hypothetical protein
MGTAVTTEDKKPRAISRKVGASAIAGGVTVILVWIVNTFLLSKGTSLPAEVASAITTVISGVTGWIVPDAE